VVATDAARKDDPTVPTPNLYDAAAAFRALNAHRPGWRWGVVDEEPVNGRFYVDHSRSHLLLPGYLTCGPASNAFIDAAHELLCGAGTELPGNVTPIYRRWGGFDADPYQRYGGGVS
jgi:hypothetical protein